ncbi:cardiolipin synthase [Alkalicoccobacillus murimartini]|uniref:Cardiolipin synthase n=1 Tax=Alkalicoccobacillus murimartini TaxID=171685 RepID=A0ABT9YHW2_9BACI|nr:cardiolipin synthase [Alkalicoccobacillus murimartini]MDQ0207075.1 cardiolipin synthase [Alkalicoccobacillus murimartini]
MIIALIVLVLLLLIIVWLRVDYVIGYKKLHTNNHTSIQESRYPTLSFIATGEDFFDQLFADIRAAHRHIHLLFYIFKDDHIGSRLIKLLEEKATEGVDVIVMVDWLGNKLPHKTIKRMQESGILFTTSHTPAFPTLFFSLNCRNHRKIAIIDGKLGYVGGFNAGDEYLGRDPKFGFWRDLHLRLEGDGVQDLQKQFLVDLDHTKTDYFNRNDYYPHLAKGAHTVRLIPTDGHYLEDLLMETLQKAKSSILLGSPYYIPSDPLQELLINSAQNGISVKLILPQKSDHPLVKEGSMPYVQRLVESGVDVYHYDQGFYHAKALVIDQSLAWVSTANLDKRSFYLNSEMTCMLYDQKSIQELITCIQHDMQISEKVTKESFQKRSLLSKSKEQMAGLLSGLL